MGGAVLAWNDFRNSEIYEGEIYAQRVLEGLTAAPLPDPASTLALFQNHPNPFNPQTVIRFYLPVAQEISLDIYNVAGQWVARLTEGKKPFGQHEVTWDGRNSAGVDMASGVYLARLRAGKHTKVIKLVLVR